MSEITAYREQIADMSTMLDAQLAETPDDKLYQRPGPSQNPIGFIFWHILRIWDLDICLLNQTNPLKDDIWHRDDYSTKANYTPDGLGLRGLGMGVGYSDAEVDGVQVVPRAILTDYKAQLVATTTAFLDAADESAIRTERPSPLNPAQSMTSAMRLQHIIAHSYHHLGEIRFIKGTFGISDPTYPKS